MNETLRPTGPRLSLKHFLPGLLIMVASMVIPLGYLVAPAYLACAAFKGGSSVLLPLGLLGFAAALALYGLGGGIYMSLLMLLPAILLILLYKKKTSPVYTFGAISGVCILLLYLMICLEGILSGEGAFAPIVAWMEETFAASRELLTALPEGYGDMTRAEFFEFFDRYTYALTESIATIIVPSICQVAMVLGLTNVLFFQRFARSLPGVEPLPPFRSWKIPGELTNGLFFLLVASLVLELFDAPFAEGVSATVNIIVGFPLTIQGLCLIDHLIHTRSKHKARTRVLVFLCIGILYYVLRTSIMLLGFMEQLFHLRDKRMELPPQMPKF